MADCCVSEQQPLPQGSKVPKYGVCRISTLGIVIMAFWVDTFCLGTWTLSVFIWHELPRGSVQSVHEALGLHVAFRYMRTPTLWHGNPFKGLVYIILLHGAWWCMNWNFSENHFVDPFRGLAEKNRKLQPTGSANFRNLPKGSNVIPFRVPY